MNDVIFEIKDVEKKYGSVVAVDHVSFNVHKGEIFCIVGPNGAGKTTLIECIEGIRDFNSGEIYVLGVDVTKGKRDLYQRIGVQLQESRLQNRIKVWEVVDLFASFYKKSVDQDKLLLDMGLTSQKNKHYIKLSGGQKQRLFIALALINDPEVLFLDELTTGLDPHAKRQMWKTIKQIRENGKTVFFTTHSMEEAEELSDRILILDKGKIVALDSPKNLISKLGDEKCIILPLKTNFDSNILKDIDGVSKIEVKDNKILIFGKGEFFVNKVIEELLKNGVSLNDLQTKQANMEDVYLFLTEHRMS